MKGGKLKSWKCKYHVASERRNGKSKMESGKWIVKGGMWKVESQK